jgi:hypothetical protein
MIFFLKPDSTGIFILAGHFKKVFGKNLWNRDQLSLSRPMLPRNPKTAKRSHPWALYFWCISACVFSLRRWEGNDRFDFGAIF